MRNKIELIKTEDKVIEYMSDYSLITICLNLPDSDEILVVSKSNIKINKE